MRLGDRVDDRETEADAPLNAGARGVRAPEPLEDLRERLLGHAFATVFDLDHDVSARCT